MLLRSAVCLSLAVGLEIHEPAHLAGEYQDTPASFAPANYDVNALAAVATSCPCEWEVRDVTFAHPLVNGRILLVHDGVCTGSCPAQAAACAAQLANASGILVPESFNPESLLFNEESAAAGDYVAFDAEQNASCDEPIPTAYVSVNASKDLVGFALQNRTDLIELYSNESTKTLETLNLTMSAAREAEQLYNCDKYAYMPLVYLLLVPVWWLLTVLWTWNTYRAHAAHARDLHRLLCWVPIMQFVHGILSLFNYSSCPWDTTLSLVYATFWAVVTILKEPVVLLCLLLVAKGWCITRNTLQRREVCFAGCNLALLYAAVSVQLSVQSLVSTVPMVLMYLAMLGDVVLSIFANLRILKAQLMALRSFGIDPCTTPAHRKYIMFLRLAKFTALYVLLELTIHTAFTGRSEEWFWLFVLLHQLMELFIAVGIGYTFRAQPFNVLFQQVQQVATELADQLLPSITTVEIKPDLLNGADLIAWRSDLQLGPDGHTHMPATLVVLNPGDKEMPPPSTVPARRVPAAVPPGMPPPPPPAPAAAPPRRSASRVLGALSPTRLSSRAASGVSEASSGGGGAAAPPSVTTTVVEVPARSDFDVQELSGDGVEAGARAPPSRRGGAGAEDDGVELETLGGSS